MKRKAFNLSFLILISFSFQILIFEIWSGFSSSDRPNVFTSAEGEHFDPSLSRLKTISNFTKYCDSIYGHAQVGPSDSEQYAIIVSRVLRDRFYHGYSYYRLGQNSLAYLCAPIFDHKLRAIVIPDDILRHPNAACSQQSIVGMEVFKSKGFKVRKVAFFADGYGGHFCFEAYFDNKWHFFDPDMEPKLSLMSADHFPPASELVQNESLLRKLYFKNNKEYIKQLFASYSYGPVNRFPAPRAIAYQYIMKYLGYTLWVWFALMYFFARKKFVYSKEKEKCVESQDSLVPGMTA